MTKEIVYCPHCKKDVVLARSNWGWFRIFLYGLHIYPLYKRKDKCSICGKKIKD